MKELHKFFSQWTAMNREKVLYSAQCSYRILTARRISAKSTQLIKTASGIPPINPPTDQPFIRGQGRIRCYSAEDWGAGAKIIVWRCHDQMLPNDELDTRPPIQHLYCAVWWLSYPISTVRIWGEWSIVIQCLRSHVLNRRA